MTRNVFPNSMVAHVWAQQNQPGGRSNNGQFYFSGPTIYSYGSHFPIASFVERGKGSKSRRAVLFTTRDYSSTTSQHKGDARGALHDLGFPVFRVPDCLPDADAKANLVNYRERFAAALLAVGRARTAERRERLLEQVPELAAEAEAFARFYGLRPLKLRTDNLETAIAEAKAAAEVERAANAVREEARRKADAIDLAKRVERWRNGEDVRAHDATPTMLRVRGDEVETSRGATFPADHARRAFAVVKACHDNGREFIRNGETVRVGHFQLDRIDPEGNVKAGCHSVPWVEVVRCAAELGLTAGEGA